MITIEDYKEAVEWFDNSVSQRELCVRGDECTQCKVEAIALQAIKNELKRVENEPIDAAQVEKMVGKPILFSFEGKPDNLQWGIVAVKEHLVYENGKGVRTEDVIIKYETGYVYLLHLRHVKFFLHEPQEVT